MSDRVPVFAPYVGRDRESELFGAESGTAVVTERSLAIDASLTESVERWINGDMDAALQSTRSAERYLEMTDEDFDKFSKGEK